MHRKHDIRLADDFAREVCLLKHFYAWSDFVIDILVYRQKQRPLLRKIILLWMEVISDEKQRKKSLKLFNDFIGKKRCFNMLQNGFGIWRQQTLKLRDILKRRLKKLKKKERYLIQKQMKRKLKLTFSLWYTQTKVTRFIQ